MRTSPRLAEFVNDNESETYFLFVEQITVYEVETFSRALFTWFCIHYVYHLDYCASVLDFCTFFQEFIFGLPCGVKRSATYLAIATNIQRITVR